MVTEEDDVTETVSAEAARGGIQRLAKRLFAHRDRPRKPHVPGWRFHGALGNIGQHRRDERITEGVRDPLGEDLDPHVVLAQRHVRAVLLGAADRQEHRRLSGSYEGPELGPCQSLERDRIGGLCVTGRGQDQDQAEDGQR